MLRKELNEKLKAYFNQQLIKARADNGCTQAQMAKILAMDTRSYIDLEHGKSNCSSLTLALFLMYICPTEEQQKAFLKGLQAEFENLSTETPPIPTPTPKTIVTTKHRAF